MCTKIDYTFIHNKGCELIRYLEAGRLHNLTEQQADVIHKCCKDIAFNEAERSKSKLKSSNSEYAKCPKCGKLYTKKDMWCIECCNKENARHFA